MGKVEAVAPYPAIVLRLGIGASCAAQYLPQALLAAVGAYYVVTAVAK